MTSDDVGVALWPGNERSVEWFMELGTQWRVGAAGPVGLDYNAFFALAERRGLTGDDFEQVFVDLRILEDEALATMQTAAA